MCFVIICYLHCERDCNTMRCLQVFVGRIVFLRFVMTWYNATNGKVSLTRLIRKTTEWTGRISEKNQDTIPCSLSCSLVETAWTIT